MKRSDFIRQLLADGCLLVRHGSKHDVYANPATGKRQTVPRHSEIDDTLVKQIRKRLGLAELHR
jgi:mRNA interferase HicA